MEGVLHSPVMASWPLSSPQAAAAFCYPPHAGCDPFRVAAQLEDAGVCCILGFGRVELTLGGVRVRLLGKGHSSVVVAGQLERGGLVAVKVRRTDSKRESLEDEGRLLEEASRAGASPRPIRYSRDVIVMQFVSEASLQRVLSEAPAHLVSMVLLEAIRAARALDTAYILHEELHRPLRNIFYPYWPQGLRALILDLESAARGCGNVNKVVSFLLGRGLLADKGDLRPLLRDYREGKCPRDLYVRIEETAKGSLSIKALAGDLLR